MRIARAFSAAQHKHAAENPTTPFTIGLAADVIATLLAVEFPPPVKAEKPKAVSMTGEATEEEWLRSLEALDVYRQIDVRRELGKAQVWAATNKVKVSRKRFVNWLNKADATIGYDARGKSSAEKPAAPKKQIFSEQHPPLAQEWRYALRYQITEDLGDTDTLCDKEWRELPAAAREAILAAINP